jgi:glycosyltransferase involved in cell wall biosynthesis
VVSAINHLGVICLIQTTSGGRRSRGAVERDKPWRTGYPGNAMSTQPLVSVIIPAFRAEATLPGAIRSLLAQTWRSWQAIVASDDGVDYLGLLADRGVRDHRLAQVFTGACGSGEGNARNAALPLARGQVLCNLDADDAFRLDRLEKLAPLAAGHGAAVDNTGVHGPERRRYKRPFPEACEVAPITAEGILRPRIPFFPVFRRELVGDGWTRVAFAADVLFNLELLCVAPSMVVHPESLYLYFKRAGSITEAPDAFETAERGYADILRLLDAGALRLSAEVRTAAHAEFTANRRLNRLFGCYMTSGRCASLEGFLDMTENGRASWVRDELARLDADPARAA